MYLISYIILAVQENEPVPNSELQLTKVIDYNNKLGK